MRLSRETLSRLSGQTGYRQEILEKVSILLSWLDRASNTEKLSESFTLKGGRAIWWWQEYATPVCSLLRASTEEVRFGAPYTFGVPVPLRARRNREIDI